MNQCYWTDAWGNCWSQEQVEYYWSTIQQAQQQTQQQMQQVQQTVQPEVFSIQANDILILATQYWWIGAIFLVGIVTMAIAGYRIFAKSKIGSELTAMWFGKKEK